jgi:hypothetical protein
MLFSLISPHFLQALGEGASRFWGGLALRLLGGLRSQKTIFQKMKLTRGPCAYPTF